MPHVYRPEQYWEDRFARRLDLATVGHLGLGAVYNGWLYRRRFRAVRRGLHRLGVGVAGGMLVDVGVGSGAWIPFWRTRGVRKITGLDLTATSVRQVHERYPDVHVVQADITGDPRSDWPRGTVVTAFDVLFHITDDEAFARAVRNIAHLAAPGGWVMISDSFCPPARAPSFHVSHRSYEHYRRLLSQVTLEPVHLEPVFFAMSAALCAPPGRAGRWLVRGCDGILSLVEGVARRPWLEWLNHLPGSALYLLDGLLGQLFTSGPSLKILFARKRPH